MQRILQCGGEVDRKIDNFGQPIGEFRVYEKGSMLPALGMSRSLGDLASKKLGVIAVPKILEYNITDKTNYILVCSDGISDFIGDREIINIGKKYYNQNPSGFCNELVFTAHDLWKRLNDYIDDITAVVAFF